MMFTNAGVWVCLYECMCVCVCMCVCMNVCAYMGDVCACVWEKRERWCMCVCVWGSMCVCLCINVCMYYMILSSFDTLRYMKRLKFVEYDSLEWINVLCVQNLVFVYVND